MRGSRLTCLIEALRRETQYISRLLVALKAMDELKAITVSLKSIIQNFVNPSFKIS